MAEDEFCTAYEFLETLDREAKELEEEQENFISHVKKRRSSITARFFGNVHRRRPSLINKTDSPRGRKRCSVLPVSIEIPSKISRSKENEPITVRRRVSLLMKNLLSSPRCNTTSEAVEEEMEPVEWNWPSKTTFQTFGHQDVDLQDTSSAESWTSSSGVSVLVDSADSEVLDLPELPHPSYINLRQSSWSAVSGSRTSNSCIGTDLHSSSRTASLSTEYLDVCTPVQTTPDSQSNSADSVTSPECPQRRGSFTSDSEMPTLRRCHPRQRSNTVERYELSQDLQEKQLEMLVNKYGGRERTQHAVRVIQSKYREYQMKRNFEKIISEKRLSRRIDLQRSVTLQDDDTGRSSPSLSALSKSWSLQPSSPLRVLQKSENVTEEPKPPLRKQLSCEDVLDSDRAFMDWQMSKDEETTGAESSDHDNKSVGGSTTGDADSQRGSVSELPPPPPHLLKTPPSSPSKSHPVHKDALPPPPPPPPVHHGSSGSIHTSRDSGVDAVEDSSPTGCPPRVHAPPPPPHTARYGDADVYLRHRQLRHVHHPSANHLVEPSPVWKRKTQSAGVMPDLVAQQQVAQQLHQHPQHPHRQERHHRSCCHFRTSDKQRKRTYRIGLNLFNKKPEKGIAFLVRHHFIENTPLAVAKFLLYRKGLAKEMVGLYLCNHSIPFNVQVLNLFVEELDFRNKKVDEALREFNSHFVMKGEAQIIERVLTVFSDRYSRCNSNTNADAVLMVSYSIMMLNTDLHKNLQTKNFTRMTKEQYVHNLMRTGEDLDEDYLRGIYDRIESEPMVSGSDHVAQVRKVEASLVGRHPALLLPHRRLVCFCKLFEVSDPTKREKPGSHERAIFLFNDLLLVSKVQQKRKEKTVYQYRKHFSLVNMQVFMFEAPFYKFGIRLASSLNPSRVLVSFNARNEHDRSRFVEDLQESVLEMNEMEGLRIEEELAKQQRNADLSATNHHTVTGLPINRFSGDSGLQVDLDSLNVNGHVTRYT